MERSHKYLAAYALAILAVIVWAYWSPFYEMARKWTTDAQYSQGYVVPLFAAFLIWLRRGELMSKECQPSWWGALPVFLGLILRLTGTFLYHDWLETISLLPVLWGVTLLLVGWRGLACTWYAVAFLFFMIPLPYRIETALSHPLQRVATLSSTATLQTLGFPAFAEGNLIVLNDERIGIIQACNGLGMLMLFFALAVAIAILSDRPLLDRILLIAAAAPIAVIVNTIRITVTTIISDTVSRDLANKIFHDWAGVLMMPMALGMLWGFLKLFDLVIITEEYEEDPEPPPEFGFEAE